MMLSNKGNITPKASMTLKLMNRKNSCFVNVCIQLLYSIPEVKELFTTGLIGSPAEHPVSSELGRLMRETGCVNMACILRDLVSQSTGDIRFNRRIAASS